MTCLLTLSVELGKDQTGVMINSCAFLRELPQAQAESGSGRFIHQIGAL
jgi:hypothetical protein